MIICLMSIDDGTFILYWKWCLKYDFEIRNGETEKQYLNFLDCLSMNFRFVIRNSESTSYPLLFSKHDYQIEYHFIFTHLYAMGFDV